jgi:hypothetical protein
MFEFSTQLDPAPEHLTEPGVSFLASGAVCGRARAVWVLGPPSGRRAVIIQNFFDGRTGKRSVEPLFGRMR